MAINSAKKTLAYFGGEAERTQNKPDDLIKLPVRLRLKKRLDDLSLGIFAINELFKGVDRHNCKAPTKYKVFLKNGEIAKSLKKAWVEAHGKARSIFKEATGAGIKLPNVPIWSDAVWSFKYLQIWIDESICEITRPKTTSGGEVSDTDVEIDSLTKEQQWRDNTPEYIPNTDAIKMVEKKISAPDLSKLLRKSGNAIRWMYNEEIKRCKVHTQDFMRHLKIKKNSGGFSEEAFKQRARQEEIDQHKRNSGR
jgi:hypothetical protein